MLDQGRELVILDHLVLDVGKWINEHPGGRFTLQKVVGSDISKFFFGGYSLENNLLGVAPGHIHSYYAKRIVNDLAIGHYEQDIP
jgi:cytochrome b involved in lipid metabolism